MENGYVIQKFEMSCPLCDKIHEIEKRVRGTSIVIKGEKVSYKETYYFCKNSPEEENEFTTGKLENENLLNARNEYRKMHGFLTSNEIVEIRVNYGLSQVDLSKLLNWGEATISRYESKAIQDEAHDNILRIIKENPLIAMQFLQKNKSKFTSSKAFEITQKIKNNLDGYGKEYLKRQALESDYVNYKEPCDANGFKSLDIDKLEHIVSYYAKRIKNLYKVKLMKLLWYTDSLFFKLNNTSLTGLVYCHDEFGALPIGHYKIVDLEKINQQAEEGMEYTRYRFLPNETLDESCFSDEEIRVLEMVISKFKEFNTCDIVDYMHDEIAYIQTNNGDIIPFSLAKEIRAF